LAIPKALKAANLSSADISLYEINEAFSLVVLANLKVSVALLGALVSQSGFSC
jgi:acetyl-CoA acetyltransferase